MTFSQWTNASDSYNQKQVSSFQIKQVRLYHRSATGGNCCICAGRRLVFTHSTSCMKWRHGRHFETLTSSQNKKLSYRRETARQLRMSTCRLANWSCNAQNTAESQRLYYFWHSNALIEEVLCWPQTHVVMKEPLKVIHFAFICRSTIGSISSHIIACRISDVFEDVGT